MSDSVPAVGPADLGRLLRDLGSRSGARRTTALYMLAERNSAEIERALNLVNERVARISRTDEGIRSLALGFQALNLGSMVLRWLYGRHWDNTWWGSLYLWATIGAMVPLVASMLYRARAARVAARVVEQIARIDDKRVVTVLVGGLALANGRVRDTIVAGLMNRLPGLTEADRGLIPPGKQAVLVSELGKATVEYGVAPYSPRFAVAILHALEATGDEDAIPAVRRLAERPQIGSPLAPVIQQARQCLDVLVARQEEERDSRVLVRAADRPAEALLKPAEGRDRDGLDVVLLRAPEGE